MVVLRVVAGGTRQREATLARRVDRGTGSEQGGLERRAGADRVGVDHSVRRPHLLDELMRVAAEYVLDRGGRALDEPEPLLQHREPLLRLRVRAGRMEVRKRGVAEELQAATFAKRTCRTSAVRFGPGVVSETYRPEGGLRMKRNLGGPALVVAAIALFVALGEGAVAAGIVPLARHALTAGTATNALKFGGRTPVQIKAAPARGRGARRPGRACRAERCRRERAGLASDQGVQPERGRYGR